MVVKGLEYPSLFYFCKGSDRVNQEHEPQTGYSLKQDILEWVKAILIATVIVVLVRWLLFTPTLVSGQSMEPSFHSGERVIVNKMIYHLRDPQRGEVIVFHAPDEKDFIKRVIGVPGDSIRVHGDEVYINDILISEPYIQEVVDEARARGTTYNHTNFPSSLDGEHEVIVPDDSLFVMGDNRSHSLDSRSSQVGFIPHKEVVGRADIVFWPISDIRFIQHPNGVIE